VHLLHELANLGDVLVLLRLHHAEVRQQQLVPADVRRQQFRGALGGVDLGDERLDLGDGLRVLLLLHLHLAQALDQHLLLAAVGSEELVCALGDGVDLGDELADLRAGLGALGRELLGDVGVEEELQEGVEARVGGVDVVGCERSHGRIVDGDETDMM